MTRLLLFLFALLLIVLGTPVFLLAAAVQTQPLVSERGSMAYDDAGRIKSLLKQHDPRKLQDGQVQGLVISADDLNLLLNTAVPYGERQRWQLALLEGQADINFTLALPANPMGEYLNLSARLEQDGNRLKLGQLGFGDRRIPGWLFNPFITLADRHLRQHYAEYDDLMSALQLVQAQPESLRIVYEWQSDLAQRIQSRGQGILLPEEDRQRIGIYYDEIANQSRELAGSPVSLNRLLQPLFELAAQRCASGGVPELENRALLLALGLAISGSSGRQLATGIDSARQRALPMRLTLQGRDDLAKHFAISAALAAAGGSALADAIGVIKEVDDSRGGSGFSFADLLADRAGVALADAAMGPAAAVIQERMSNSAGESVYMPGLSRLPEGLMELEFKAAYEDLDSATYALVETEIERRIVNCPLYRPGLGQGWP